MRRWMILLYGIGSYLAFLVTFLYLAGFIGGFLVPTKLDGFSNQDYAKAFAIDFLLLLVFALQHSVMARPVFKKWWTQFIPSAAERSTYVMATNLALALLFWQWRPLGGILWSIESPPLQIAVWILFVIGWLTVFISTCLINHFDLFGLRQVWLYFRSKPYTPLPFKTPGFYRYVRHPLYVGWILAFWATPTMTVAHFVFASIMTIYILIAIQFEERDLVEFHPDYLEYRRRVPMLIPSLKRKTNPKAAVCSNILHESLIPTGKE